MSAINRVCSISDCEKPSRTKGYCNAHYARLLNHGDPLGGGTSPGAPLRFIHEVALLHTSDECLAWPFGRGNKGYGHVWVNGKIAVASRYVCELAHGAPPTPEHEAAHSCGNGDEGCINPGHLSWKTHVDNMADMLIHDTHQRGERNWNAKLTEAEAREILAMKGVETQLTLAERFGVSYQAIANIHRGRKWAWLAENSKEIEA